MKQSAHLFWHRNQAKEVKDGDAGWIQMHIGLALKKQCSKPSKFSQTLTKKSHKFAVIHRIAASVWSALALISANYWLSSDASVNKAASVLCTAVQPPPPQQVTVKKRASSWFVTWNAPPMHDNIKLLYQICYGGKDEQVRETQRLRLSIATQTPQLITDRCPFFFSRAALSGMFRRAPRLTAFWSPSWPRPRTTGSRSDL